MPFSLANPWHTVLIGATAITAFTRPGRRLPAVSASSAPFEIPHRPTFSYPISCSRFAAASRGSIGTLQKRSGSPSGTGISQNGTSGNNTGSGTVSDGSGSTGNTAGNNANGQNTAGNKNQSQIPGAVQTGDNTMILPFVVLVMAAALVIAAALLIRQKKNA